MMKVSCIKSLQFRVVKVDFSSGMSRQRKRLMVVLLLLVAGVAVARYLMYHKANNAVTDKPFIYTHF